MKNYKKVLLKGLEESNDIKGEDREDIKESIKDIYSEVVEELESFKHTFWLNFRDDTLKNLRFITAMQQLIHVLSTGDDEIKVTLLNIGIKIELIA